eukprot:COSAG01_NODE_4915_length_4629_cov_17.202649_3_plen_75_part_00
MPTDPAWAWKVVKLSRARDLPPADFVRAFAKKQRTIDYGYVRRCLDKYDMFGDPNFKKPRGKGLTVTDGCAAGC